MAEIIGYLYTRDVDSIRRSIYVDSLNLPSTVLDNQKLTGSPITVVLSKAMAYTDYEKEIKNPMFPEYIYINDVRVKNINNENGKRII